jgi:hypothetical protein
MFGNWVEFRPIILNLTNLERTKDLMSAGQVYTGNQDGPFTTGTGLGWRVYQLRTEGKESSAGWLEEVGEKQW